MPIFSNWVVKNRGFSPVVSAPWLSAVIDDVHDFSSNTPRLSWVSPNSSPGENDPLTRTPALDATVAVNAEALAHGVITIRAGLFSNCVRFLPSLAISDAEVDEAMDVVAEAVATVAADRAR